MSQEEGNNRRKIDREFLMELDIDDEVVDDALSVLHQNKVRNVAALLTFSSEERLRNLKTKNNQGEEVLGEGTIGLLWQYIEENRRSHTFLSTSQRRKRALEVDREFLRQLRIKEEVVDDVLSMLRKHNVLGVGNLLAFSSTDELRNLKEKKEQGEEVALNEATIALLWEYIEENRISLSSSSTSQQSGRCALIPVQDGHTGMYRCMKQAFATLSGRLSDSAFMSDPSRNLKDRIMELGTNLNDDSDDTEKILFRNCYGTAISQYILPHLEENKPVLVGGAPGVGKSVLGILLSIVLVHLHHKVVLFEHSGARILLSSRHCKKKGLDDVRESLRVLYFDTNQFDVERHEVFEVTDSTLFEELREMKSIVFIQDIGNSKADLFLILGKPYVLITSPDTERIKHANRRRQFNRVFLPHWTLEELNVASRECFRGKFTPEQVQQRFAKFGGIIRSVLDVRSGSAVESADIAFENALNECTLESLSETFRSAYEHIKKGPISSMLIHVVPVSSNNQGVSSTYQNKFASEVAKEKLMERFVDATTPKAAEFLNAAKD